MALEMRPRDRQPLAWAKAQANLGTTLVKAGRTKEAIEAIEAAMQEITQDNAPSLWAQANLNLAVALGEADRSKQARLLGILIRSQNDSVLANPHPKAGLVSSQPSYSSRIKSYPRPPAIQKLVRPVLDDACDSSSPVSRHSFK